MSFIQQVARGHIKLPSVPRVVTELLLLLKQQQVSLHVLADVIEQDPVIAARTLQLANSPFFGGARTMETIAHAIATLGTEGVQRIVLTVGISSVFVDVPGVNLRQFWVDATIAASSARALARMSASGDELSEPAFLAGLLHGTGHLILCASHPEVARRSFDVNRVLRGVTLTRMEQDCFGTVFPVVGAGWLEHLKLPQQQVRAVAHQLQPLSLGAGPLAPLVHLGATIAAGIATGKSPDALALSLDPAVVAAAEIEPDALAGYLSASLESLGQVPQPA